LNKNTEVKQNIKEDTGKNAKSLKKLPATPIKPSFSYN
jgi:hypothetical protein